jgi:hypothetical protein
MEEQMMVQLILKEMLLEKRLEVNEYFGMLQVMILEQVTQMGKQMQLLIFMKMLKVKSLIRMLPGMILEQVTQMVKQMH